MAGDETAARHRAGSRRAQRRRPTHTRQRERVAPSLQARNVLFIGGTLGRSDLKGHPTADKHVSAIGELRTQR